MIARDAEEKANRATEGPGRWNSSGSLGRSKLTPRIKPVSQPLEILSNRWTRVSDSNQLLVALETNTTIAYVENATCASCNISGAIVRTMRPREDFLPLVLYRHPDDLTCGRCGIGTVSNMRDIQSLVRPHRH